MPISKSQKIKELEIELNIAKENLNKAKENKSKHESINNSKKIMSSFGVARLTKTVELVEQYLEYVKSVEDEHLFQTDKEYEQEKLKKFTSALEETIKNKIFDGIDQDIVINFLNTSFISLNAIRILCDESIKAKIKEFKITSRRNNMTMHDAKTELLNVKRRLNNFLKNNCKKGIN